MGHKVGEWWKLDQGSDPCRLGPFSGQRKGRNPPPWALETLQDQDHHTPILTCPGDLWTRGLGKSVSHAGHLWEAWEPNPPAFDPLITHHHHSELDSFLLPITVHPSFRSAGIWAYTPLPPAHLLEGGRS